MNREKQINTNEYQESEYMKASEIQSVLQRLPGKDRHTAARLSDTRRPRLTLRHLHALRKHQEALDLEHEIYLKQVKAMYGASEERPKKRPRESTKYLRKLTGS